MRQYEPIWQRIKQRDECIIEVKLIHADRVKKAVIKEKDMDRNFKLANAADPCVLTIAYIDSDKEGYVKIVFLLKQLYGITEKVVTP